MDIFFDGLFDYDDSVLFEMDFVIVFIYLSFSQLEYVIMKWFEQVLMNKYVDIIVYLMGWLIGRWVGYEVDIDMLIEFVVKINMVFELNVNFVCFDLWIEYLIKVNEKGVILVINMDVYNIEMFDDMKMGVIAVCKGWIEIKNVLNVWLLYEVKVFLMCND